ncbi:MAG: aminotransferase class V-fold PLP-dependent enzyme [Coprobacillus sp.]
MKKDIKLFTVGPAQMYKHTLEVRNNVVPYFRTPEFSELMLENSRLTKKAMHAQEDSDAIFLTCSGSGAMEATVINCFNEKDKLLIVSGGTFGERFEKICEIHGILFIALKLEQDEELTAEHFDKYENQGFTGLLVNLHETYTGQLYNIEIISSFCKRNNLYLVVDAISAFLCDEYNMAQYDIDATIISSQKGLCLAPGLSIVVLSKRIIEDKVLKINAKSLYFDFKDYLNNMRRGQTPFTPSVGVCFELNDMLKYIDEQGVENRIKEVRDRCNYFRSKISNLPITLPSYPLSNAISPIRFDKDIANEFFTYLKDKKNIMVNPVGGELGKSSIRIAHIGELTFNDYDILIEEIKNFFGM